MNRIIVFLTVTFAFASTASAQTVELSATQQTYNDEGVQFVAQGKLKEALSKFQASLTIGEANITHLNIGRTFAKLGDCKDAKASYAKVKTAPKVASPTPKEVEIVLGKYEKELPDTCPARLEFTCTPPDATVTLNGEPATCDAGFKELVPGEYTVTGSIENAESAFEEKFTLGAGDKKTVAVSLRIKKDPVVIGKGPDPGLKTTQPKAGMSGLNLTGLVVAGLGAATLITALIIDFVPLADVQCFNDGECDDDVDPDALASLQTVNTILIISGGVLTTVGVVLFLLPSSKDKSETSIQFTTQAGMAGVRLRTTW